MRVSKKKKKLCERCGEPFLPATKTSRFCSRACSARYRYNTPILGASETQKEEPNKRVPLQEPVDIQTKSKRIKKTSVKKTKGRAPLKPIPISEKLDAVRSKPFLNISEAALLLGISRTTLYVYLKAGELECMRMGSKTFISQKSIYDKFGLINSSDFKPKQPAPPILEYYTMDAITEKFRVTDAQATRIINRSKIPNMMHNGVSTFGKTLIDTAFAHKAPKPKLQEWYSVADIVEKYGITASAVSLYGTYHKIPKKKEGNKVFYSRKAFEKARANFNVKLKPRRKKPSTTSVELFYSSKQARERLGGVGHQTLYYHLKKHDIPTKKEGYHIRISKSAFDKAFPIKEVYS